MVLLLIVHPKDIILKLFVKSVELFEDIYVVHYAKIRFWQIHWFYRVFSSLHWQKCPSQLPVVQDVGYSIAERGDMKVCENTNCTWKGMFHYSKYVCVYWTVRYSRLCLHRKSKCILFQQILQDNTKWLKSVLCCSGLFLEFPCLWELLPVWLTPSILPGSPLGSIWFKHWWLKTLIFF